MWEVILSEITCDILEQTHVIFGTVKEEIMEIPDEHLGAFHTEIMAIWELALFPSVSFVLVELPNSFGIRTQLLVGDSWQIWWTILYPRGRRSDLLPIF